MPLQCEHSCSPLPQGEGLGGEGASSGHCEAGIAYAGKIIPDTTARKREFIPSYR